MAEDIAPASTVREVHGVRERLFHWILLDGNRLRVALAVLAVVFAVLFAGILAGVFAVGPNSLVATAFASGLVSGTLTLTTIALSVNQLILSRVLGSPDEFVERLDGTRDLRDRVAELADEDAMPSDPAAFLSALAVALAAHARAFGTELDAGDWEPPAAVADYVEGIATYGENIDGKLEAETSIVNALEVVLGTEYARNMTVTRRVRGRYGDRLTPDAEAELDAIDELLESVAVTRQFFKTLSLQQDFARLSRVLAYSGLVAVGTSLALTLLYRSNGVTVPVEVLPPVVAVGTAVVLVPLVVFIAYMLRAATIAHETVSVGPFVPPAGSGE